MGDRSVTGRSLGGIDMNTRRKENNLVGNLKEALSMVSDDMDYLR